MKSNKRLFIEKYIYPNGWGTEDSIERVENELKEVIEKDGLISVHDQLPEQRIDVLLYGQYGTFSIGYCIHGFWYSGGVDIKRVITHWMPLPKPPKP